MKRYFTGFAFAMTTCFLITGCQVSGGKTAAEHQLQNRFTTGITMELEDMTAEGTLQRVGSGDWNISFSEPTQLAGVRLDFQDGEVTASYKGLAFSVPQTALPAKSILSQFILVADQLAEEPTLQGTAKEKTVVVSGELEAGNYELTFAADGIPIEFEMKNQNAVLSFHDFVSEGMPDTTKSDSEQTEGTQTTLQDMKSSESTELSSETE